MEQNEVAIGYYTINGGKRILYWDGEKWMQPVKDGRGSIGIWLGPLEKQPKIKTLASVKIK